MSEFASFTAAELTGVTGGKLQGALPESEKFSISTDTRCDNHGKIFFALSGENFDGHDFLDKAANSGCSGVCIKSSALAKLPAGVPALLVDDPLSAMQKLAAYHRKKFPKLKIAAVTGSVGKTSVKEMLRAIFTTAAGGSADKVLYTVGNTNNHIGVPQNLLRLNDGHAFAAIEMGTSSPGEISPLSLMTAPDAAIVNSIAPCHLEKLIDLDGVAAEKSAVFDGLAANGSAVIPLDCASVKILQMAAKNFQLLTFGSDSQSTICARFLQGDMFSSTIELTFPGEQKFQVNWGLSGEHQASNAAAAAAAAYALGISPEIICSGLQQTTLPGMRMKKTVINGVTYINDAYNANPASMLAMFKTLHSGDIDPAKLLLVLGGMRELGSDSTARHRETLEQLHRLLPAARVITIGKEFDGISDTIPHFDSSTPAQAYIANAVSPGDVVFAKGSRGNQVELALPQEAR